MIRYICQLFTSSRKTCDKTEFNIGSLKDALEDAIEDCNFYSDELNKPVRVMVWNVTNNPELWDGGVELNKKEFDHLLIADIGDKSCGQR